MKDIIYSCPYIPAELIAAHGFAPRRIAPSGRNIKAPAVGACPYAHAFAETAISHDAAGIVVSTLCDQMRRAFDLIESMTDKPAFLLNMPHTWQSPGSFKLYVSELRRLEQWLLTLGGIAPSRDKLAEVMVSREHPILPAKPLIPLALVGGPVPFDSNIFELIERAGGYVALDATETGERGQPPPFDGRRLKDEPFEALAEAYFAIPDVSRRPNSELYRWFGAKIKERGVRGVIMRRYIWCDCWHAEAYRMKEWLDVPFLHLDVDDEGTDMPRTLARLQSFVEILK